MSSWGRHGWPRKDEIFRLYRDKDGSFFMTDAEINPGTGHFDAVAEIMAEPDPNRPGLASTSISRSYLLSGRIKRVQWSEMPEVWQRAFRSWLDDTPPEEIRGFWLAGQQPRAVTS